jgi:hypothetical protein
MTQEDIERGRQIFESGKYAPNPENSGDHAGEDIPLDDQPENVDPIEPPNGAELLDDLVAWFARFIAVTNPDDFPLLAL